MQSPILTDDRGRRWQYTERGLFAVPPTRFFSALAADPEPEPLLVRIARWLTDPNYRW